MVENLVIVESPTKAKTIEKFLGSDFIVKSSFGHVRDLPKRDIGVDVDNNFTPSYEISADKKKVVDELKSLSKKAKNVWLASDEDREGEAIAWHLSQVLDLDLASTKRIVFHEITKNAITKAVSNPRIIDINLVNAQQARRILDRLVGFELSPVLWKKVKPSLSAGRVQSVAVRLIVDKERDIINFKAGKYYRTTAVFTFTDTNGVNHKVKAELNKRFEELPQAEEFINNCVTAKYEVLSVERKPAKRSPAAPFTTSTLQQDAGRKLGFSVNQTMTVAQRLYEAGLITYMRTDSVNLSADAMNAIQSVIEDSYGVKYHKHRVYKTKSKGAQEAHEAIRPSYIDKKTIEGSAQEKRLYDLIWKRTVASQMSDAILEKTVVDISISGSNNKFVAKGEVVVDDGFLKLYSESVNDDDNTDNNNVASVMLPAMNKGDVLSNDIIEINERYDQRPARFSEASLVKHLEELGIGRPSTYAPTISTIINRGYVVKEDREGVEREYIYIYLKNGVVTTQTKKEITGAEKAKLFSTNIGMLVNDYLESHFPAILDYNFTANVEESFDNIAEGSIKWEKMITEFYKPFHESVLEAKNEEGSYATSQQRFLGVDEKSGKNVYARIGRFGPMVQIGESGDEDNKPQYASLHANQLIETITLQEAMELFALPRNIGKYEDKDIVIGIGRFGPYIRHDGKFVSISKEHNPYTINIDTAIDLIEKKRKDDREKLLVSFDQDDKMQILKGRWGAYIAYDGNNYKLPKGADIEKLTYDDYIDIVDKQKKDMPTKSTKSSSVKKTRDSSSKTTKKSTTAKKTTKPAKKTS